MNKILRKAVTVITAVLAISTSRSAAHSACSSDRFTAAMQVIGTSPATPGRCFSCHSNFPVNNEQAWVPHYVVPGNPASSLLWQRLTVIPQPPRTIMPPSGRLPQDELDKIYDWIANFNQTTVTVVAQPGGTVSGGGKFTINFVRTITATPNLGWTFAGWNDGNLAASRNITVPSCDVTYTASFQPVGSSGSSLANVSTRLSVQTDANIGIAGFIITGQSQTVVIRGLGPTLSQFGVEGVLADPTLLLFNEAQQAIASNDDWQTGNQVAEIQSSGFAPAFGLESVLIATLPPGKYTAQLQGFNNTTGVALVEVYGLPQTFPTNLSNMSTRGLVQTGGNIMIGGFIITGQSQKVVIRGLGPTLSQFGVQGILADPTLLLLNGAHQVIASNDDWQTGNQVAEIQSSGFAPAFPLESVLIATLPPGNYTAQLQGFNSATGVGLVEVYIFP